MVLYGSCTPSTNAKLEANKEVVREVITAIDNRMFDLLDELVMPDLVRHSQATPGVEVRSLEQFKEFLTQDIATFPDAKQELHTIIAKGDKVAVYLTFTGTQDGPMGPFPATGKKVDMNFLGMFRLENGKVAEIWVEWDNLNILTQLGHFPPATEE
jgi:predicted ester cyclase